MNEMLMNPQFLWDCLWQSTLILALGMIGSGLWSHRAARAHRILLLSILAALLTPVLTQVARQQGWGILPPMQLINEVSPIPRAASLAPDDPSIYAPSPVVASSEPSTLPTNVSSSTSTLLSGVSSISPVSEAPWILPAWPVLAMWLWGLVSFIILLRLLICLLRENQILRAAEKGENPEVERAVKQAVYSLQLEVYPEVRFSKHLHCPVIWCWGRQPVLYLPYALKDLRQAGGLAGVICHELAHGKRKDHWAELLGLLGLCLLPWQPLLWWVQKRRGALSELACDEWVLACGHFRRHLLGVPLSTVVTAQDGLGAARHRLPQSFAATNPAHPEGADTPAPGGRGVE